MTDYDKIGGGGCEIMVVGGCKNDSDGDGSRNLKANIV